MVQNNYKRPAHRSTVRPVEQKAHEAKCKCGEACKCDESCTCGCKSSCSSACGTNIINGILVLIGTLFISGAILRLSDSVDKLRLAAPRPQQDARTFESFVRNNPKIIVDTVNKYYQKQQAAAERPAAKREADPAMISEIIGDKANHVLGNPKGSFVVIEFFDYNCGFCKKMNKAMAEAVKKSNNIRWILMDTPIFGEKSEVISRYAAAAAKQGKYAEFHAAMADANDKTEEGLKAVGKKLGLNVDKLAKDANSDAIKNKLAANKGYTKKLQLGGVPMFIIDGKIQSGAFSDEQMAEYIKKANEMKK